MSRPDPGARRLEWLFSGRGTHQVWGRDRLIHRLAVLLLFCIYAYLFAPFSFGDKRVQVPEEGELDARQQTLLVEDSIDKLLTDPRSFYDTAILYPDRNQLRTLEPILGYALVGLPLRTILRLNDVDVFEALRWVIVFTCLIYAYLLFRAIGVDVALSVAGAVLCLSQPDLVNDIGRLNIICLPLIVPVLYHGVMAWTSGRLRHSVGLFVVAALYPLCGMVNATLSLMAALFILPLLVRMLAAQHREKRLAACLLPIVLAGVLDGAVTAPWLLDRSDLAIYVSDAFLQIKHWNAMAAPGRVGEIPGFVTAQIGWGVAATLVLLCLCVSLQHAGLKPRATGGEKGANDGARQPEPALPAQAYLSVVCVAALGLAISASYLSGRLALPWLKLVFQIVCYGTLLLYWRRQIRFVISSDQQGIRNYVVMLSAGLGVFACLMSFGPVYVSNSGPLASHIMRLLLDVLPPLRAIREFYRVWILGILFVSIYLTVRLASAVRLRSPLTRVSAAVVIVAAAMLSLYNRPLIGSTDIEAPRNIVELASHSRGRGALYVHPRMQWHTPLGVWMIPIAKALGRPIVNGYLGIAPPWFGYASSVLHRFPDPESLWLLQTWKVNTVVSLAGPVGAIQGERSAFVDKVFENADGAIYEIAAPPRDVPHPSGDKCLASEGLVRLDGGLPQAERVDGGASLTMPVPKGFRVRRVEIAFRQSAVEQIPESIDVYAIEGAGRVRLNQDHSGEWIESLAAAALVRRESPVATIGLSGAEHRALQIELRKAERQRNTEQSTYANWWHLSLPPVERIGLCGEWTR